MNSALALLPSAMAHHVASGLISTFRHAGCGGRQRGRIRRSPIIRDKRPNSTVNTRDLERGKHSYTRGKRQDFLEWLKPTENSLFGPTELGRGRLVSASTISRFQVKAEFF